MCKVLKISESGYYRLLKNKDKPSKRQLLLVKIKEILSEHPDNANYGYDRIHKALEIRGIKVSRNTVYHAMKDGNLIHKARKPHGTTEVNIPSCGVAAPGWNTIREPALPIRYRNQNFRTLW